MQIKMYFNKWSPSFIISIIEIVFYIVIITFLLLLIHGVYSLTPPSSQTQISARIPLQLEIPSLNIKATIEEVGLTSGGEMDVPKLPEDVAWLNLGTHPGDIGSSVIDGHSGYKDNKPAVFDSLNKLKKGDEIDIVDNKGMTNIFIVQDLKNYKQNTYPSNVFSSNDGKAHLNLITCSGLWDKKNKTHSLRLIVFADKISP